MAGTSDLPLETISLADRATQISWGEMLTDWILCVLLTQLRETICEAFTDIFVRLGCYKTRISMKYLKVTAL